MEYIYMEFHIYGIQYMIKTIYVGVVERDLLISKECWGKLAAIWKWIKLDPYLTPIKINSKQTKSF